MIYGHRSLNEEVEQKQVLSLQLLRQAQIFAGCGNQLEVIVLIFLFAGSVIKSITDVDLTFYLLSEWLKVVLRTGLFYLTFSKILCNLYLDFSFSLLRYSDKYSLLF